MANNNIASGCNESLYRALALTKQMLELADTGDDRREDVGCGILFGMIRDCAYKIRALTAAEIAAHKSVGKWLDGAENPSDLKGVESDNNIGNTI